MWFRLNPLEPVQLNEVSTHSSWKQMIFICAKSSLQNHPALTKTFYYIAYLYVLYLLFIFYLE